MSVEEKIATLKEREGWDIEKQRDELERRYKYLPEQVRLTSAFMGIEPELLIRLCNETGFNHSKPWHHVLSIMHSFYISKMRIEGEEQES